MTGTISSTITSTYDLMARYTTVLGTGEISVTSGVAIAGTYVSGSFGWTVTNYGTVLNAAAAENGIDLRGVGDHVTNNAGGVIGAVGNAIYIARNAATVVNAGTITTSGTLASGISLAKGGYVSNAASGTITSAQHAGIYVSGGAGTIQNSGLIATYGAAPLGPGVALLAGGSVENATTGRIVGQYRNAVYVTGAVGTVVNAGQIVSNGTRAAVNLLGAGSVTNQSGGTITSVDGASVYMKGGVGTVINVGNIINTGTNGADIDLLGGGFVSNATTGQITSSQRTDVYITGGAGTILNAGRILTTGSHTAVALSAGGSITNQAGGTITGGPAHSSVYVTGGTGTVVNYARIASAYNGTNGVHLHEGGALTNRATGTIFGGTGHAGVYVTGAAGTVVNYGLLMGYHTSGVFLNAGGTVINQGATGRIEAGTISGSGVFITGGSSGIVVNAGLIDGVNLRSGGGVTNQASGTIAGTADAIYIAGAAGTVINAGGISGAGALERGVDLGAGGLVINAASASITGGFYGVQISGPSGAGTVINDGTIAGGGVSVGVMLNAGGTLTNAGTIIGGAYLGGTGNNLLVLDPGSGFSGLVAADPSASNTLGLASAASAGTVTGLGTEFLHFGSIEFNNGADWFISGDQPGLAGTISGFTLGDTIEVTGISATGSSYVGGVLTLDEASGSVELNLPGSFITSDFVVNNVAAGADITVTCFAAGTRVRAGRGEVPVENLRVGDLVMAHGADEQMLLQPIEWIGYRSVDCRSHPKPNNVWPVRIIAGAFGSGRPARDLLLSPDHAVFIAGVLIPIKHLVNHRSIAQVPVAAVEYFHIELPAHAVLLAENLPVESYLDVGGRLNFAGNGVVALHPDFSLRTWEAEGCGPLIVTGPELDAVRRRVNSLAPAAMEKRKLWPPDQPCNPPLATCS